MKSNVHSLPAVPAADHSPALGRAPRRGRPRGAPQTLSPLLYAEGTPGGSQGHPHGFGPVPRWDSIPVELRLDGRWCVWKASPKSHKPGKFDKVPHGPKGQISTADPGQWLDFHGAKALYEDRPGEFNGVGILVEEGSNLVFVDVDGLDQLPEGLPSTYTERSPSGNGLRAVYLTPDPPTRDITKPVEIYSGHSRRFVTLTGDTQGPARIARVGSELRDWVDQHAPAGKTPLTDTPPRPELPDTAPSLDTLREKLSPQTFAFLADGGGAPDRSAALFAAVLSIYGSLYPEPLGHPQILALLADSYAMTVALNHRGNDRERALDYLWQDCIKAAAETRVPPPKEDFEPVPGATACHAHAPERLLISATEIRPEAIEWLWPGKIACGKLHIIAGRPATGKTTVALDLAARITAGTPWPDGTQQDRPRDVVIWSGEDGLSDTLVPRLMAAGADLGRVHFVKGETFDIGKHLPALRDEVQSVGDVALIIVDPLVSVVGKGDSNNNGDVRRGLQPLVDLCERVKAAAIGISHFTKGTDGRDPLERVTGSLAFGATARIVFATARDKQSPERMLFIQAKANITRTHDGGFEYQLASAQVDHEGGTLDTSRIVWGDRLTGRASDILAQAEGTDPGDGKGSKRIEAQELLKEQLRRGPVPVSELHNAAKAHGIGWRTMERAKQTLGVIAKDRRAGGKKASWCWELPFSPDFLPDIPPNIPPDF